MKLHRLSMPSIVIPLFAISALGGCHSIAEVHHGRLERMCRVQDEIIEISKKLQNIEQVMLYAGRIQDSPLADAALDVAIAIQGAPDETEKRQAERITAEEIKVTGVLAANLLAKRNRLEALSAAEGKKAMDESFSLHAMESRYRSLQRLVFGCSLALGFAVVLFFLRRVF